MPCTRLTAGCLAMLLAVFAPGVLGAEAADASPADASQADASPADAGPDGASVAGPESEAGRVTAEDTLSIEQQQLADKFQRLQDLLLRMAELSELADPRRAALLKKAVRESEKRLIGVQFESLVGLLEEGRLSRAIENQADVRQDLQALLELLLSENRARRVQSEQARIRRYLKRLNQIIKQQKGVQGRTAGSGPPKPLADQQGKLADVTGDLARDIKQNEKIEEPGGQPPGDAARGPADDSEAEPRPTEGQQGQQGQEDGENKERSQERSSDDRPQGQSEGKAQGQRPQQSGQSEKRDERPTGQDQGRPQPSPKDAPSESRPESPGRRRVEAAEQRMREAQAKLEEAEREGAVEKQEAAIQELQRAKAELERILRQLREEEIERTLTLLEARFRKMLQMQREVYEGTLRLDKVPKPDRAHNHEIEASRLGRKEAEIVLETDKALTLLRDDGTAVAFPEALRQVREDMRQVVGRLDQAQVGPLTQTVEEAIIAALEEMIEAVEQARQEAEAQAKLPMPPGPPQDRPLVDLLAEIKMIRAMQMRVNRRTQAYAKLVEGEQASDPGLLEALRRLAERQAKIHQITRDLEMGKNR
jgi:hypothetical protein